MEYFSGLSGEAISFSMMMIISFIAHGIFAHGMLINMKKWGFGSEGYWLDPSKGSVVTFLKTFIAYLRAEGLVHHGQPIITTLVLDILFQRRILRRSPLRWFMHVTIFVGWMTLFVLSFTMFVFEILHLVGVEIIDPAYLRDMLAYPNTVFSYILLVGVIIAVYRRLFVTKVRESTIAYDSILLLGLVIVVVTGFVSEGIRTGGFWGFGLENPIAPPAAFFHVIVSLFFCIAYIPYSKYIHVIATPLTILANKGGE
jgi:heterodisulfide reductase subunit E